ncbi:hypothetical protein [Aliidiomarina sp.]|uniref:hypothetical protein n=1 Tax=Aliidiomarina sp. TaxID=1872439 RepID=UPI003A4D2760
MKVSPFAAFGRDVDSAGFGGSAKIPENVAAWVIADHSGVDIERLQTHSNRHFDSAPIFVMDKATGDFYEYEFDSETEEWTCSKNGEEC